MMCIAALARRDGHVGARRLLARLRRRRRRSSAASATRSCTTSTSRRATGRRSRTSSSSPSRRRSASSPPRWSRARSSSGCASAPFLVFAALWSVLVYAVLAHWAFGGGWLHDARHARLRRRRAGRDGLRLLGARGGARRRRAQGLRAPGAAAAQRGLRAARRRACCGSAGSASTAAAASRPATRACSRSRTRCSRPACTLRRLVRARPDPRPQGDGDRRGDGDHRRLRRRSRPAGGYISPGWAMVLGALGALPSYAVIVWRPRTRVDETLDVLAAHGIAGFTGILFIGFFAQVGVERRLRRPRLRQRRPARLTRRSPRSRRPPTRSSRPSCCCG